MSCDAPPPGSAAIDAARLISQVVDYAIISLDPSGTIESWNLGAERLKGYSEAEAIGRNFSICYAEQDRESGLPQQLLHTAEREGRAEHSGWRVRADGSRFWGDITITALHDDEGTLIGFAKVTRDRTEQHALQDSLQRSGERFRLLVDQVGDYAIIALDPDGIIESWNLGAERLKGYTHDEAVGQHFSMFYPPRERYMGLPLRLLATARRDGSVEQTGWRVRADGSCFWGDVIITAIRGQDGRVSGFAKVTRDLTARRRFDEAREQFFATFAHDFKTPINAISGYAELLPSVDGEDRTKFLAKIQSNAERLSIMTTELVEHSRQNAEGTEPIAEWLDTVTITRQAIDALQPDPALERVHVAAPSLTFVADRSAMLRILTNLLSNALKYSSQSGTPVIVDAHAEGELVLITVTDTGRGIEPEDLPGIFNEFERGRLAQEDGGSGLGLTSVKRLVNRQGGQIDIESRVGRGTTVTLTMPGRGEVTPRPVDSADAGFPHHLQ